MKILHTSDWHLGIKLNGYDLFEDQEHVLKQIVAQAVAEQVDVVVIPGDIYDRPNTSGEALALFNRTVQALLTAGKKVIVTAGNHDAEERIEYLAGPLAILGLYISGALKKVIPCVTLDDIHGRVHFYQLAYCHPFKAREIFNDPSIATHADVVRHCMDAIRAQHPQGERAVVLAHVYVAGAAPVGSEWKLDYVGGSELVPDALFEGMDYVALGHLHSAQKASKDLPVHYSGTPFPYSASEVGDKSTNLVELGAKGPASVRRLKLELKHPLVEKSGKLEELLAMAPDDKDKDAFVQFVLTDEGSTADAAARLSRHYPRFLGVRRADPGQAPARGPAIRLEGVNPVDLFETFLTSLGDKGYQAGERELIAALAQRAIEHSERASS